MTEPHPAPTPQPQRRGRPPKIQPADQRLTATITAKERVRADYDAKAAGARQGAGNKNTLAELVRTRTTVTIDWMEWGAAAAAALKKMDAYAKESRRLGYELKTSAEACKRAHERGDAAAFDIAQAKYARARQEVGKYVHKPERRSARLTTRLSYNDRETLAFRAAQLGITISDYIRLCFFSYLPGQADWHMSEKARRNFYHNVIRLANSGGFPTQQRLYTCPRCRETLPEQFQNRR